jgi:hypothetical protein
MSPSLVGIIPGQTSKKYLVLNSHTDGVNGAEENGPTDIVAMSQYITHLPKKSGTRSIILLLTMGHSDGVFMPYLIRVYFKRCADIPGHESLVPEASYQGSFRNPWAYRAFDLTFHSSSIQ